MTDNEDKNEQLQQVLDQMKEEGESVEEFDHDDERFEDQGPEGDMSEGDEGELP